ncbi:MAG: nickel pincer cofactor biosynthesis protein LarC [Nitrososphaerales archaeon]
MNIFIIDPQVSGISGDMIVAALIDLGANEKKVIDAMELSANYLEGVKEIHVTFKDVSKHNLKGKQLDIKIHETKSERSGKEIKEAILNTVKALSLSERAIEFSKSVINTFLSAEAKVHNVEPLNVKLHELGSADTVADIVGVTVAADNLGLFNGYERYSMPIAVGGGVIEMAHGNISAPSPVTLEILRAKGYIIVGGMIEAELTTPTGASILVNLTDKCVPFYPAMIPVAVGYGAGAREFPKIINMLRVIIGKASELTYMNEISILETNIDDVSGEVLGYMMERLFKEGAYDVSFIPIFTKKNRPGYIVRVIADKADATKLSNILFMETGTLGVRILNATRHVVIRDIIPLCIQFHGKKFTVRVKLVKDNYGNIIQAKPEYEDVKEISKDSAIPLRIAMDEVREEIRKIILKKKLLDII